MTAQHTALVSGGGSGIGAAIAARLARAGAHVLVGGRNQERCAAVAESLRQAGGEATAVELDVTDPSSISAAVEYAGSVAGPIDWLVPNAGIAVSAPIGGEGWDELCQRHLDVNYHGARRLLERALPAMRERKNGRVVMVASSAALQGYAYIAAYAASKHALLGYARCAALELARAGVRVHAVCPYYVDTPMLDESVARLVEKTGKTEQEARAFFAAENPSGELVTTDEVAGATLELLQAERTGVVLELPGGGERREVDPGSPQPG